MLVEPSPTPNTAPNGGGGLLKIELADMVTSAEKLPGTPWILPKLQGLLRNANANADDVIDLVKLDVALTGRVLRYANSSYYGMSVPVQSVGEAVNLMGFREIYKLVSVAASRDMLGKELAHYGLAKGEMLKRSIATAMVMMALADGLGIGIADTYYTIGLMHGIGKIVIDTFCTARGMALYEDNGVEGVIDPEQERHLLGYDNAQVGAAVLEKWRFPPEIVEPVRQQLEPEPGNGAASQAAWTLTLVSSLIGPMLDGTVAAELEVCPVLAERAGFDEVLLRRCLGKAERYLAELDGLITA